MRKGFGSWAMMSVAGPRPGDFVLCRQRCTLPYLREYFELAPAAGEAFIVMETGLPVPPGFEAWPNGLRLRGVLGTDGGDPAFGIPASRFVVCPEVEAEPGWHDYLRRLDRHRLSNYYRLIREGIPFEDLPPLLRQWWLQRH